MRPVGIFQPADPEHHFKRAFILKNYKTKKLYDRSHDFWSQCYCFNINEIKDSDVLSDG